MCKHVADGLQQKTDARIDAIRAFVYVRADEVLCIAGRD